MKNSGYAKFMGWGANKLLYGRCASSV